MAEYAKKTVAELQEILKSRGLPSSGKKAELIARLNENDKELAAADEIAETAEPATGPVTTEPAQPATTVAPTTTQETPLEPATAQETTDPTTTVVEPGADHPSPDTTLAAQTNYSLNLPTSDLDSELAKRKARAERFGTSAAPAPAAASTTEPDATAAANGTSEAEALALKNLERAKRFGTGQDAISKLDEALPSETLRGSRKRAHEPSELDDAGLKRGFANRGRGRGGRFRGSGAAGGGGGGGGGGGRARGAASAGRPQGVQKSGVAPAYTSEKDKMAAEARRKKFATA